jgi:hypothetical protein
LRWCKTLFDKILGVLEDGFEAFPSKIIELYFSQTKATPEVGFLQRMKQLVQVAKNFVHKQINPCSRAMRRLNIQRALRAPPPSTLKVVCIKRTTPSSSANIGGVDS